LEIQRLVSDDPLELPILLFQLLEPPCLAHPQPTVLLLPAIQRLGRDSVPPTEVGGLRAGLVLLKHAHNLLGGKSTLPHRPSGPEDQHNFWLTFRGSRHLGIPANTPNEVVVHAIVRLDSTMRATQQFANHFGGRCVNTTGQFVLNNLMGMRHFRPIVEVSNVRGPHPVAVEDS